MVLVSLLTKPAPVEAVSPYVWRPSLNLPLPEERGKHRWYQTVAFWAVVAAVMYLVIYVKFW
jgi:hypothetical protein